MFNVARPSLALFVLFRQAFAIRHANATASSLQEVGPASAAAEKASGRSEGLEDSLELHHPNVRGKRKKKTRNASIKGIPGGDPEEAFKLNPWKVTDMQCGETHKMASSDIKDEFCPPQCPYYSQDRLDDEHCTFLCVPAEDCAMHNPNKPIADFKLGTCRAPMVAHCRDYVLDGTDTCQTCQSLYRLDADGKCHYKYFFLLWILLAIFVTIVVFLVTWVVDFNVRPITNQKGLDTGVRFRSNQKLRQPKPEGGGQRTVWPFNTNLTNKNVAGPGMMLHMNFQKYVIIWAFIVACIWTTMALIVDHDLFILGTRKFGTPRDNCILVAWGYETQQRLMWTKVTFLAIVYVFSFVASLVYGVHMLRKYQEFDFENDTFKDFAAMCYGLPNLSGADRVEDQLKKAIAEASGVKVVGVSVCWDYEENEEEFQKVLGKSVDKLNERYLAKRSTNTTPDEAPPPMNPVRQQLFNMEMAIFSEDPEEEKDQKEEDARIKEMLQNTKSTQYAFAVFETEDDRNRAMKKINENGGFKVGENSVRLKYKDVEPDTVLWRNFGEQTLGEKIKRWLIGFGCIGLALLGWTTLFYAPYAWSVMNFNYDNGQEPGFVYGMSFSMVVVVGNAIMYETCNRVSVYIGFKNNDNRESCYTILYTFACTWNIMVDMVTTYFIALYVMQGLDFRTYDGTRLAKIDKFHEQFDTYAMQRSLAQNTYGYAFPSTFLIPFVIEPFATVMLPLKIGTWLVRSHPEMQGRAAEGWLQAAPMDLGRYGDLMLDIVLGILIFYFPGGYTHSLFFAMAVCHTYIYCFDHWKILSGIPACCYASMSIDWYAQAMLAPCCALILSCLIFKGNCQDYGYCLSGGYLVEICVTAWILHVVVHLLLLIYVVPKFGLQEPEESGGGSYHTHAERNPANWFVTNPILCLRSRHIYNHKTPVTFFECGKEHLMEVNSEFACYFQDNEAFGDEDARDAEVYEEMTGGLRRMMTGSLKQEEEEEKKEVN